MNNKSLITAALLVLFGLYFHAGCGGGGGHGGANRAPAVTILGPKDGENCVQGETIAFLGTATDPEDGSLTSSSLVWTATPGGTLGTGESFTRDDLSVGTHTITLTATDSEGASSSDSITICVTLPNELPAVTIVEPDDGATFYQGATIVFFGGATDPEDGNLTGSNLVWTAVPGGRIGTGQLVTRSDLPASTYTITLTATDSHGASASDSITIHVRPPNRPPKVTIYSPTDGAVFFTTCPIIFEGTAVDFEDGVLTGDSLVWILDPAWEIGTGESFILEELPEGTHTITLHGIDSAGGFDSKSTTIEVRSSFVQLLSISGAAFPTIEVTVLVNTDAGQACYLTVEDFVLTENWVSELVESVVCAAGGGVVADIVVVFDDSGSMSDNIEAMKAEATTFATEVLAAGLDAWFGLITTVDSPEIDLGLTADVGAFQAAVDTLTASGGVEPSLDGVMLGLQQMPWRPGAVKVFLVVTDEPTNGDHYTMSEVVDAVNAAGGTVFAVSEDYRTTELDPGQDDVRVLAEETGGIWLDINEADFSILVDEIVRYLASLYRVVYTTSNPVADGSVRCVEIRVTDPLEGLGGDCDVYETLPTGGVIARRPADLPPVCSCR